MLIEQKIRKMVSECVAEELLKEEINAMISDILNEKKTKRKKSQKAAKKAKSASGKTPPKSSDGHYMASGQIIDAASDPVVKDSSVAYKLYPNLTPGGARSKYSKELRRERPMELSKQNKAWQMMSTAGR